MQGSPLSAGEPRALPLGKILPQYLKDLGYTTRIIGKWHLGYYKDEFTPTRRGFDSFLGYLNGFISYYDHINQESVSKIFSF
jgi:arylsulfatase A-like enzyme